MQIRGEGLVGDDGVGEGEGGSSKEAEKVVYVLHPNCAVEDV